MKAVYANNALGVSPSINACWSDGSRGLASSHQSFASDAKGRSFGNRLSATEAEADFDAVNPLQSQIRFTSQKQSNVFRTFPDFPTASQAAPQASPSFPKLSPPLPHLPRDVPLISVGFRGLPVPSQAIQGSAGQPLPSPAPPTLPQPSLKLALPTHRPPHSHGASVQASGCSPLPSGVRESECVSAWLGQ